MSVPAATARYVIAADDKSQSAIRSIVSGFKEIDRNARATFKTVNAAAGLFLGVQLTQAMRRVLSATAESTAGQAGFARALKETSDAAKELLAAKSGLPEATQKMEELRDVLKDPATVAAVDSITSALISGFTGAAKAIGQTVAGLRELSRDGSLSSAKNRNDVIEALNIQIDQRRADLQRLEFGARPTAEWDPTAGSLGSVAEIQALRKEIEALEAAQQRVFDLPKLQTDGHGGVGRRNPRAREYQASLRADREAEEAQALFRERLKNQTIPDASGYLDVERAFRPEELEGVERVYEGAFDDIYEYGDRRFKDLSKEIEDSTARWGVFADQAARNMQDVFAEFLFDPFSDGLDGMLKGFVDVLRRMLAEAAASRIFEAIFGANGAASGFGSFLSAIFGTYGGGKASGGPLEQGKWYVAGERGPEPIWGGGPGAFAMGYGGGGGITVAPTYNIDARGADRGLVDALPEILRRNNEQLKADIVRGFNRRKYPLPR